MLSPFTGKKKTVLILGSTGKLASHFINKYDNRYQFVGVSRSGSGIDGKQVSFKHDITKGSEKVVRDIISHHSKIDAVINATVVYDLVPLLEKEKSVYEHELRVGLSGPLDFVNQLIIQSWSSQDNNDRSRDDRSKINITSGSGLSVINNMGQGTYSTIKSAQNMLTKHQSQEYKQYGVRVNAVAPGYLGDTETMETTCVEIAGLIDGKDNGVIKAVVGSDVKKY